MSSVLPMSLSCPSCGCQRFKFPTEPPREADSAGCVCADCGANLTAEYMQQYLNSLKPDRRVRLPDSRP